MFYILYNILTDNKLLFRVDQGKVNGLTSENSFHEYFFRSKVRKNKIYSRFNFQFISWILFSIQGKKIIKKVKFYVNNFIYLWTIFVLPNKNNNKSNKIKLVMSKINMKTSFVKWKKNNQFQKKLK